MLFTEQRYYENGITREQNYWSGNWENNKQTVQYAKYITPKKNTTESKQDRIQAVFE